MTSEERLHWIKLKIDLGKLTRYQRWRAETLLALSDEIRLSNQALRELEEYARQSAFGRRNKKDETDNY